MVPESGTGNRALIRYDPEYFLGEGNFSIRDPVVKDAAETINSYSSDNYLSPEKAKIQKMNFFFRREMGDGSLGGNWFMGGTHGRERTASEIIQAGNFENCVDRGLLWVTLARELGIPARYAETFDEYSFEKKGKTKFHVFADFFIDGEWVASDPGHGFNHRKDLYFHGGSVYAKIADGLDHSSLYLPGSRRPIGVYNREQLKRLALQKYDT